MPILHPSSYCAPSLINKSAHYATVIPGLYRQYSIPNFTRERLELKDGDFLDLDWLLHPHSDKLLILSHGLEGHSRRPYMCATADYFYQRGFSALAWNQRSCSEEMNRNCRLYHHGTYDDLSAVIEYALQKTFNSIYLVGFSMGGAVSFNYLGNVPSIDSRVKGAVGISTPIDIAGSAEFIDKGINKIYVHNFLKTLKSKIKAKGVQFPHLKNLDKIDSVRDFATFDNYYTAPIHGFKNAEDYYETVSPIRVIHNINRPILAINALNDPMLSASSYPYELAQQHPFFYLETPQHGGHCGFPLKKSPYSWAEIRAYEFINALG